MSSTAIRRIHADIRELRMEKNPMIYAAPLEDNLFEWHFTIHGTPNSDYEGGIYHGRILLPPEWPIKPPQIIFCTVNGRFEVNTPVCLSFTSFHPEEWQPSWGIRTILEAIISFFPVESEGAIGSICCSSELRKRFAKESRKYVCPNCGPIVNLIAPLTKEQIQSYYTSPITPEEKKEEEKEEEVKVEEVTEEEVKEEINTEVVETAAEPPAEEKFDMKEILNAYRYSKPDDCVFVNDSIPTVEKAMKENLPSHVPSIFPKKVTESLAKTSSEYYEAIRKRHTTGEEKDALPPFVPIYIPVVVPVYQQAEKKPEPEKKVNMCMKVLSILLTIMILCIYGLILYLQLIE